MSDLIEAANQADNEIVQGLEANATMDAEADATTTKTVDEAVTTTTTTVPKAAATITMDGAAVDEDDVITTTIAEAAATTTMPVEDVAADNKTIVLEAASTTVAPVAPLATTTEETRIKESSIKFPEEILPFLVDLSDNNEVGVLSVSLSLSISVAGCLTGAVGCIAPAQ